MNPVTEQLERSTDESIDSIAGAINFILSDPLYILILVVVVAVAGYFLYSSFQTGLKSK